MILVSFFSEDKVLSDGIKICYIFEYQSDRNRAFCFFWDTLYSEVQNIDSRPETSVTRHEQKAPVKMDNKLSNKYVFVIL